MSALGKSQALGCDSHDDAIHIVNLERLANGGRISTEVVTPETVANHDNGCGSRFRVSRRQKPAAARDGSQHAEQ